VLSSASEIKVPPPPAEGSPDARAELAEVRDLAAKRTPDAVAAAHHWGDYPVTEPWTQYNMKLVSEQSKNPPLASRGYGLMSVSVYDAVVAAWHWKYVYNRDPPRETSPVVAPGPDPSYPDEHAVIAGAASRILAYLFPEHTEASYDQMADDAAEAQIAAGTAVRSDIEAGLALGRSVADRVLVRARADGSDAHWDGVRPTGPGTWAPPPGSPPGQTQPVEPLAGSWHCWVIDPPALRAPPPPPYGSSQFVAEATQVRDVGDSLTDDQKRIATFWAGGKGTPLPPGIWNQIALDEVKRGRYSTPTVARDFALLNVAEADAGVAAWDSKYAYWSARPVNAIHDLGLAPQWQSFLPTPIFPSYISGHSTYSAAAAEVLAYEFPAQAQRFRDMAKEAGMSRIYGGIHYMADNLAGLEVGTRVGRQVTERARTDGAR
jgi:membrane-associated phospholipid phosphatase